LQAPLGCAVLRQTASQRFSVGSVRHSEGHDTFSALAHRVVHSAESSVEHLCEHDFLAVKVQVFWHTDAGAATHLSTQVASVQLLQTARSFRVTDFSQEIEHALALGIEWHDLVHSFSTSPFMFWHSLLHWSAVHPLHVAVHTA